MTKPYIYRNGNGNIEGLFAILLQNITRHVCGLCNGKDSEIDYVNDGKNGWAEKQSTERVTQGIPFFFSIFIFILFIFARLKAFRRALRQLGRQIFHRQRFTSVFKIIGRYNVLFPSNFFFIFSFFMLHALIFRIQVDNF